MELYIHIPFCLQKCAYCSFVSYTGISGAQMDRYISSLLREAAQRKKYITEPLNTVYIGGGTPSLLSPEQIELLICGIRGLFQFSGVKEFTVEANPGTVTAEWLKTVSRSGVNRISFGMQSYQEHLLKTLGRIHRYADVISSVKAARDHGIENINLDLMFGIPGQSFENWQETLDAAVSLSPAHISAYGLIPEEGTPMFHALESGCLTLPDPELERDMYDYAIRFLASADYRQYEISNFSRPGYECRHNIGYWDQIPYIGLGISASSMIRTYKSSDCSFSIRWTNPSSFQQYNTLLSEPENLEALKEIISSDEARFETIMLSLRMNMGLNRSRFRNLHGDFPENWYGDVLKQLEKKGLLFLSDDCWRLTRRGMDIQNSVLLEFMRD